MTALEKMAAAQWKIDTVMAQMIGAGFMTYAAAGDGKTREIIFKTRIQKYIELYNAVKKGYWRACEAVELVAKTAGEPERIPEPWEKVWGVSDEEALAVMEGYYAEAYALEKEVEGADNGQRNELE